MKNYRIAIIGLGGMADTTPKPYGGRKIVNSSAVLK